jgi:hypothetical protein
MQKPPEPIGSGGTLPGRHPSRPCDVAESCTGVGASCPADGVEPPTTECRVPEHVCDAAGSCTGSSVKSCSGSSATSQAEGEEAQLPSSSNPVSRSNNSPRRDYT